MPSNASNQSDDSHVIYVFPRRKKGEKKLEGDRRLITLSREIVTAHFGFSLPTAAQALVRTPFCDHILSSHSADNTNA
eukprot:3176936-Rhodomonas_salina.2